MKSFLTVGLLVIACLSSAFAQDWYHERDERFRGEQWRAHVFEHVRTDLDHIGSAAFSAPRERRRLDRTRQELGDLQAKLDHGHYAEGELNDVIDSLTKSSNDQRLSPRDRQVLYDDVTRLRDYREHHDRWLR